MAVLSFHDELRLRLAEFIHQLILISYKEQMTEFPSEESIYSLLTPPPSSDMGDMAFACFQLSKALKNSPAKIAEELSEKAKSLPASPWITKIINHGPYLNFELKAATLGAEIVSEILDGTYFQKRLTLDSPRTMVEFSQPNTHKEIHVGHMRNLCLGDALIRLNRYAGLDIVSSTFPGDVGTHVAKCLWYLKTHNNEAPPATRKGAWLGRMYSLAHNKLEDERGTEKEASNRAALTTILKQIEHKNGEYYDLWKETRAWSIELMQEVYRWADVKFDQWYWESDVDSDSVKLVQEYYKKGLFTLSEGAVGMDLNDDKLGFCLLLKSDGTGLYATKDLELARKKFLEHKIQKSVYVVDKRQALHFQQVFKTLEKMGFPQAKDCFHLQYDFVELPDGAMSSRKGNIVPIQALIDQMVTMIKTEYLQRYVGQWPAEEIDLVANQVAKGAIKFGMCRIDNNKKIVFDMKEWLKLDGESGPYIQYVFARINSLCLKLNYDANKPVQWNCLTHHLEKALMLKLADFNSVVLHSAVQYKPSSLCAYLYDLGKLFNSFYAECSVGQAETDELKVGRLALAKAVSLTLKQGLNLLGIPAPERM